MPTVTISPTRCKTALNRTGIPGYRYCLNPYMGCSHGCHYCYADTVLRFSNRGSRWGEFVAPKVNLPEVLRREVRRKRGPLGSIILSTVTDAYQLAEEKFHITRDSLEVLSEEWPDARVDLLTKSDMVVRDLDVLKRLKNCSVGFSLAVPDDKVASELEPGAPSPSARLLAAKRLIGEGLKVWAFIAPVLPGVTDAQGMLGELFSVLKGAGIEEVYVDPLNPYRASLERLKAVYRAKLSWALRSLETYLSDPRGYLRTFSRELALVSKSHGYDLKLDHAR